LQPLFVLHSRAKELHMTKAQASALSGVVVAVISVLVSQGVLGGDTATSVQTVMNALIAFAATVGIRSARP